MKFLQKYADNTKPNSIVNKWRRRRFSIFINLINGLPKPIKILDIGGTENFWLQMGFSDANSAEITILNSEPVEITQNNINFIRGDARNLGSLRTQKYDVIFSNSVIEHVGGFTEQQMMADEILKFNTKYYVQTPSYYFPMEPHFLFPCFQFLPMKLKIFLVMNFRMGWFDKRKSKSEAIELINSIRLLKKNELAHFFPEGKIQKEKFLFLTKSFIVTNY